MVNLNPYVPDIASFAGVNSNTLPSLNLELRFPYIQSNLHQGHMLDGDALVTQHMTGGLNRYMCAIVR